ncbi:MAG: TraR/DksA family transcriptional regulator [Chlamydiae bacterium]|nr:TraR/DksA family transcriptional regulator [Chlamydiota bacterium]
MPLEHSDIIRFKKRLEELRGRMCLSSKQTHEGEDPQDVRDESFSDSAKNAGREMAGQDAKVLRQIARALEKMEENTYGICDLTGEEISLARLEAVPYAVTTVKAQERLEKGLLG